MRVLALGSEIVLGWLDVLGVGLVLLSLTLGLLLIRGRFR